MCQISKLAEEYKSIQEEIEELEQKKSKLRKKFIDLLGVGFEGVVEGYKIKISEFERETLDANKARKILDIDTLEQLKNVSTVTSLRIKKLETDPE